MHHNVLVYMTKVLSVKGVRLYLVLKQHMKVFSTMEHS